MRKGLFWLSDRQWARIEPHLPQNLTGPERGDDRRIIAPVGSPVAGLSARIWSAYNHLQSLQTLGQARKMGAIFEALARGKGRIVLSLDSTSVKAHRSASGGKGRSILMRSLYRCSDCVRGRRAAV